MRSRVLITLLLLAFLTALAPAQGQNVTWMVTEWGSVYRNLKKVADKSYKEPRQIAGTADHHFVATRDGSIWKDGTRIVQGFYKDMNVVDLDARGDDDYVLTLQGNLYRNGQVIMPAGRVQRPHHLILRGPDIFIMNDTGEVFRNGTQVGEPYFLDGYYPNNFATDGTDFWFTIPAGTANQGDWVYKNRDKAHDETWVVRELASVAGHLEIFSGKSLFRDWQRVERFQPDKAEVTSHLDNVVDFHFVLP